MPPETQLFHINIPQRRLRREPSDNGVCSGDNRRV
nr:unnamed protein product [Callosobruchus analis]